MSRQGDLDNHANQLNPITMPSGSHAAERRDQKTGRSLLSGTATKTGSGRVGRRRLGRCGANSFPLARLPRP